VGSGAVLLYLDRGLKPQVSRCAFPIFLPSEVLPHLDILDRAPAFYSRIPSPLDPSPAFIEDTGAFVESTNLKASRAVSLTNLALRIIHQPRSDALAPHLRINVQTFDAILADMDDADQNVVDDGYEKGRPHAFGMGASRVIRSESLNGLERQFRSPSNQP
jgi:hypothetical protein